MGVGTLMKPLSKPFIFTVSFSAGTLVSCAIWQYENLRKKTMSFTKSQKLWNHKVMEKPFWQTTKRFKWRDELNKMWNNLNDAQKLFGVICLTNAVVNLAWKFPRFHPIMIRYFTSYPKSNTICWPLVLSTFSHYSTLHLAMNMCALSSFSTLAANHLGLEQFLGLYLVGGVVSSFVSLFIRVMRNRPDMSVGASGAILAVIGYIAAARPDLELSLIFLPSWTFTAEFAVKSLLVFDITGLIFGWKFVDHGAHIGGVCFGMFWYHWGSANIWQKRETILQWWHELRNSVK